MTATEATRPAPSAAAAARAVVFPGQGSQRGGMAAAWREHPAYGLWAEADEVLGRNVTHLGLDASAEDLRDPVNCQIALFVHHAVLLAAWQAAGGVAAVTAGHSLGEYNALLAAGVISFADGLRLVQHRATATATAAAQQPGGMVACLGGDAEGLRAACQEAGVAIANDNAKGQLVVAGDDAGLDAFSALATAQRARVIRLEVGAAYHSPAMAPAVEIFGPSLDAATFRDADIDVISNVDARVHRSAAEWPDLLRRQLVAPVRWRETATALAGAGAHEVVELGASPVLTGLIKRTTPELRRRFVSAPADLESA